MFFFTVTEENSKIKLVINLLLLIFIIVPLDASKDKYMNVSNVDQYCVSIYKGIFVFLGVK